MCFAYEIEDIDGPDNDINCKVYNGPVEEDTEPKDNFDCNMKTSKPFTLFAKSINNIWIDIYAHKTDTIQIIKDRIVQKSPEGAFDKNYFFFNGLGPLGDIA